MKIIRTSTVPESLNTFCRGLFRELQAQGYEMIAVSSPGKDLNDLADREGIKAIAVPMRRHIAPVRDFVSLCQMIRVFRREKPVMVHSITPKAGLISMIAARICRIPVRLHTFTGLVFPTAAGIKQKILIAADRLICACATHIVPEGVGVKDDLINYRITRKTLRILGYGSIRGIDLAYFNPDLPEVISTASILRRKEPFTFIFVGRIVHDKGIEELVDAFIRLSCEKKNVRLILVGPYEDDLDPISQKTRTIIETCGEIIPVGSKTDIELLAYYAASDCFVLPSYREGFPNAVLEAGAMNLPCIVTDINGSREIIKDGYNGLIVPAKDTGSLFEAMKKMIEAPEMRASMANVAREHIQLHFEQGFVRQCLYDYYKNIIAGKE